MLPPTNMDMLKYGPENCTAPSSSNISSQTGCQIKTLPSGLAELTISPGKQGIQVCSELCLQLPEPPSIFLNVRLQKSQHCNLWRCFVTHSRGFFQRLAFAVPCSKSAWEGRGEGKARQGKFHFETEEATVVTFSAVHQPGGCPGVQQKSLGM